MTTLFTNDASGRLQTGIDNVDDPVSLVLEAGDGAQFPDPTGGDTFILVLQDGTGALEIMLATARTGDTITATRAQEGTTALSFGAGTRVEIRTTAGILDSFVQENAPIDMGGNTLSNASVATSSWNSGTMQAGVYRSTVGSDQNAITVPDDSGQNPHVNGDPIILQSDIIGGSPQLDAFYDVVYPIGIVMFFDTSTDPNDVIGLPAGVVWEPIPSSHGRYLKLDPTPQNIFGGITETGAGGSHTHGDNPVGWTGLRQLTPDDIPPHFHDIAWREPLEEEYVTKLKTISGSGIHTGPGTNVADGHSHTVPSELGISPAPTRTESFGGFASHDHKIDQIGDHTHSLDLRPSSYSLVPWRRIA